MYAIRSYYEPFPKPRAGYACHCGKARGGLAPGTGDTGGTVTGKAACLWQRFRFKIRQSALPKLRCGRQNIGQRDEPSSSGEHPFCRSLSIGRTDKTYGKDQTLVGVDSPGDGIHRRFCSDSRGTQLRKA